MSVDIAAYVHLDVFRSHGRKGVPQRAFYFAWHNRRLTNQIGDGGIVWVLTSSRKPRGGTAYHLAYKLADCRPRNDMPENIKWGPYGVVSQNWDACEFYPCNDATELMKNLVLTDGSTMKDHGNIGMKLQSFPRLARTSVKDLHSHAWNTLSDRTVFLSYTRKNEVQAQRIVDGLKKRGIKVAWDKAELEAGDNFKDRLELLVRGTDVFLVLWSDEASQSDWVRREIKWALLQKSQGEHVSKLVPLLLGPDRTSLPSELEHLHYLPVEQCPTEKTLDDIQRAVTISRRRTSSGWGTLKARPRRKPKSKPDT